MKLISLRSHRKSTYSILLADDGITRSNELRHSPTARDTKSFARVIAFIIHSMNTIPLLSLVGKNIIFKLLGFAFFLNFVKFLENIPTRKPIGFRIME
jgi:hypothetical protein